MDSIDYQALQPTRDYLQDIAKVVGKYEQLFLEPEPHDWHRGLRIHQSGLATPSLRHSGRDVSLVIDFLQGELRSTSQSWPLGQNSAEELRQTLQKWLESQGIQKEIETPEYGTRSPVFDKQQSLLINSILNSVKPLLELVKSSTDPDNTHTGPILLYPHHFDISLVWYKDSGSVSNTDGDNDKQIGFGFSTGDQTIAQPYFYITAYPKPAAFTSLDLANDAFWQEDDFVGAVLPYKHVINKQDAHSIFLEFARSVFQHTMELL